MSWTPEKEVSLIVRVWVVPAAPPAPTTRGTVNVCPEWTRLQRPPLYPLPQGRVGGMVEEVLRRLSTPRVSSGHGP